MAAFGFNALAAATAFPTGDGTCSELTRGDDGGRRGNGSSFRVTSRALAESPPRISTFRTGTVGFEVDPNVGSEDVVTGFEGSFGT